jgi:Flp pilus assembly protein TadG
MNANKHETKQLNEASDRRRGWRLKRGMLSEDRAQTLIELALVIPMMLLLLLGIIEIGRYAELSVVVANAARAGVQYGAQNLATAANTAGIQSAALNDGQNAPGLSVTSVNILCGCSGSTPGSACPVSCSSPNHPLVYVQVNTEGNFNALFNYPGIPSPLVVNGSAEMRVAQ